ncbi:MAG: YkgJ family cysteine cluster protein [Rhodospirillaceae bacterium]|nr:YkgJ family cysteine cluster protein [Rhodospirillaceae bacterium]
MRDRLSRPERRALQREDDRLRALPLNIGGDPRRAEAHIRHVARLLGDRQSKSGCSDAAGYAVAQFDKTVVTVTEGGLACRRGCAHCCHQGVTVTAPEAFHIAGILRRAPGRAAAFLEAELATRGLSRGERWRARIPCPFLHNSECTIYESRPLSCRGAVSRDVGACVAGYVDLKQTDIPTPPGHTLVLNVWRMIVSTAIRLLNLPIAGYEMNHAVAVALIAEDGEKKWLNGEDIFAPVAQDTSMAPQYLQSVERLATQLAPTL